VTDRFNFNPELLERLRSATHELHLVQTEHQAVEAALARARDTVQTVIATRDQLIDAVRAREAAHTVCVAAALSAGGPAPSFLCDAVLAGKLEAAERDARINKAALATIADQHADAVAKLRAAQERQAGAREALLQEAVDALARERMALAQRDLEIAQLIYRAAEHGGRRNLSTLALTALNRPGERATSDILSGTRRLFDAHAWTGEQHADAGAYWQLFDAELEAHANIDEPAVGETEAA